MEEEPQLTWPGRPYGEQLQKRGNRPAMEKRTQLPQWPCSPCTLRPGEGSCGRSGCSFPGLGLHRLSCSEKASHRKGGKASTA